MADAVASYDQLAHQVEALRQENSHLRRELKDNCHHLSQLETETFGMKEVLKQLQHKLEQEAVTLASSGRSDVLHQLKELHMDLTNYYELKHQPHNLRAMGAEFGGQGAGYGGKGVGLELALPPSSSLSSRKPPDDDLMLAHHFLDGAPPKIAVMGGADGRASERLDELYKERDLLLGQMDQEERERCWFFTQLEALTQRLTQLPRIDTFSLQMDQIRNQLEFEVQQVRSVMEDRFGTQDQVVQRTQMRASRLDQLERELHEARGSQEAQLQVRTSNRTSSVSHSHVFSVEADDRDGLRLSCLLERSYICNQR
ncbi:unnamed protein product [Knipowitschia caucasica]